MKVYTATIPTGPVPHPSGPAPGGAGAGGLVATRRRWWYPRGVLRNYIAQWPAGEIRERVLVRQELWSAYGSHADTLHRAVDAGYLDRMQADGTPVRWATGSTIYYRRTAKPCRPYQPRGPRVSYAGLFPWSLEEHWRRVLASPGYTVREVARRLRGGTSLTLGEELAMPRLLFRRRELDAVRKLLTALFQGDDASRTLRVRERIQKMLVGTMPIDLRRAGFDVAGSSGIGLRMLCLELLIEPVFDAHGTLLRFQALDPGRAHAELLYLRGGAVTPTEQYLDAVGRIPRRRRARPVRPARRSAR